MNDFPKLCAKWMANEWRAAEKSTPELEARWPAAELGMLLSALYHGLINRAVARKLFLARV